MSIYKDGKLIAGGRQCMPLLSFMWADHVLNDASWLRADTFSWQSGAVYQAVYAHLTADITGKTLQSEIISGTTIQFYLADDGHKICPASQESNVTAIYAATGVAWYYIIDTTNQRFKLPRTKFGFTGIRNGVGKFVEAGLPNITATWCSDNRDGSSFHESATGAVTQSTKSNWSFAGGGAYSTSYKNTLDASDSSSVYGNSDTVQPKATEMYLYFYVGNFTQTAIENTAGLNVELFNGKVDIDFNNITSAGKENVFNWGVPDYSAGVSKAANITHTATENGWVFFYQFNNGDRWFYINGIQFHLGAGNAGDKYSGNCVMMPISKGQTFMGNEQIIFFPCKN